MGIAIEISDDLEVKVRETGLVKSEKPMSLEGLLSILLASLTEATMQTPVLPKGCIYYEKRSNCSEVFVIEVDKGSWDFEYHGTVFKNVGVPKHLFILTVSSQKIISTKLLAAKDHFITPESELFQWPFSNVYKDSFVVCWGSAQLPEITQPYVLSCIPRLFFSQGNTDCNYTGANCSGLGYRQLLEELQGKEFNEKHLVHTGIRFEAIIPKSKEEEINE